DHDHQRRQHEHHLPRDEMIAVEADALGHRRRGGEGQHDPQPHQREEGGEEPAVDGPPPVGDRASVDTADHQSLPPAGATSASASAALRKASPRTSKFLNWSKLAQAGDNSTTASSASSFAASSAASETARSSVPATS